MTRLSSAATTIATLAQPRLGDDTSGQKARPLYESWAKLELLTSTLTPQSYDWRRPRLSPRRTKTSTISLPGSFNWRWIG
jgi:hypothetical protein